MLDEEPGEPTGSGRTGSDFHGERRKNETHASTADTDVPEESDWVQQTETRMINPAKPPSQFNRRQALQTVGATVALAAHQTFDDLFFFPKVATAFWLVLCTLMPVTTEIVTSEFISGRFHCVAFA